MKKPVIIIVVLLIAVVITACSPAAAPATPTREMVPTTIQMSWIHEYSSTPLHVAEKKGYFADEGIAITLAVGGFGANGFIDPIAEVLEGRADFALGNTANLIDARAKGLPVVGVASIMPRSPQAIISLAETGIARPQDLAGHTIAVAAGGADLTLDNLLESQGVNRDDVNIVERTFFGVEPLVNGEVDGFVGWIINEGVALEELGQETQHIFMSDYGVDTYEFVIFTTDTIVAEKPELVQGVVNAVLKGVQDTIDDPAAAIEYTLTYDETLVKEDQLRRLEATIPLINVPGIVPGSMDERVWQFTYDLLEGQDMLQDSFELGDVYTLAFIPTDSE